MAAVALGAIRMVHQCSWHQSISVQVSLEGTEDQDEDGSEDEYGDFNDSEEPHRPQSASQYPEAHLNPSNDQVDAAKEWVY
jgi:hypothetical protein